VDSLSFDFERMALTTKALNSITGTVVDTLRFGFDLTTHEQIDPALVVAPGGGAVHGIRPSRLNSS
jgi:hypothetical protein